MLKIVFIVFLIGLEVTVSNTRIISKRDTAGNVRLFATGDEYRYHYEVLVTTGTEVPISHASSYRIKGTLKVQGTSASTITLKVTFNFHSLQNKIEKPSCKY